ncbi:MAG: PadR family transcriptional regulator [Acidobacteria bacterium]|nr:MAG: PadR family transcriptional regulator [Acidobacteriota bacterium]
MAEAKSEVLQGTLDLMVLRALAVLGPLHGYGIARRLEQISGDLLQLNEGTVYTALVRLQQAGWISSEWGASENNRRARYYSITKAGRRQLARETESWERIAGVIDRLLKLQSEE